MQSMLNEISNQFTRAEGARKRREGEKEGERDGQSVGGKQSEAVSSSVMWLSISRLIGATRYRGTVGLTSMITQTAPPAINLTQLLLPPPPRLTAADRDEARSRETGDVRS